MFQGLPFLNKLGWWSEHSGNSMSGSSSTGTSYADISGRIPPYDPRVPPWLFPHAILYYAYAYVNTRNARGIGMIYDEHECLHRNECFYFYLTA
jgi:hypothetical protein